MVNDPDFQKLGPAQQREALAKLTNDQSFSSLSDTEMSEFVGKMRIAPASLPQRPADPRTGTISASAPSYLQQLEGDIRHGSTNTLPGKVLSFLGARGIDTGVTPNNPISQTILGPVHYAQGMQQVAQAKDYGQQFSGASKMLGGALDATQIPAAFLGNAPGTAEKVLGATVPSIMKEQAGQRFSEVMQAAANQPVSTQAAGEIVARAKELQQAGATIPRVLSRFFTRINNPDAGPLTYKEARDFYSIATRLSADESARLTPVVRAQLAKFVGALGRAAGESAESVGQGANYTSAMSQYASGAQRSKFLKDVLKYGVPATGLTFADYLVRKSLGR